MTTALGAVDFTYRGIYNQQEYSGPIFTAMISPGNKTQEKQLWPRVIPEQLIYFAGLSGLSILLVALGHGIAGTDDDVELWNYLIAGENGTLMLNYVSSLFIQNLYSVFPAIQWYSWLIFSILLFNNYIIALHTASVTTIAAKVLFLLVAAIFQLYSITHFSITIQTVYTIALAVLIIPHSNILFFTAVVLSSFLRTNIAIPLMPFVLVAAIMNRHAFSLNRSTAVYVIFSVVLVSLNSIIHKVDKDYAYWYDFHSAHAAYHDHKGPFTNNLLSPEQRFLARGWWVQDEALVPYEAFVQGAPPLHKTIQHKLSNFRITFFSEHRYRYLLLFLLLVSAYHLFEKRKDPVSCLSLLVFCFGLLASLLIRDEDRVTIGLLLLWLCVLLPQSNKSTWMLAGMLLLVTGYLRPLPDTESVKRSMMLKEEAAVLIDSNQVKVEGSIRFPTDWKQTKYLYGYYQLFRENSWINYSQGKYLPFGWSYRHPMYMRMHDISTAEQRRKYRNYYEFLMDPASGFIGDKNIINNRNSQIILELYDDNYLSEEQISKNCKHKTIITNESKNLSISKVVIVCDQKPPMI